YMAGSTDIGNIHGVFFLQAEDGIRDPGSCNRSTPEFRDAGANGGRVVLHLGLETNNPDRTTVPAGSAVAGLFRLSQPPNRHLVRRPSFCIDPGLVVRHSRTNNPSRYRVCTIDAIGSCTSRRVVVREGKL